MDTRSHIATPDASAPPELSRISRWSRFGSLLPWLVLVACLAATWLLWNSARQSDNRELREYFDFRVRQVVDTTRQRMQVYIEVLRGARGLFRASSVVERKEFKAYVDTLKLADDFPGIQGVGYVLVIPPAEKERHIETIRKEGFPEYTIKPEGKRDLYTSIIYIEPFSERNLRAFGFDMYSEPVRREAMERARDTGQAAMSGKVLLVQEAKQDIQAGFLIYLPIYRNDMPHETLAQRRANLVGWVYAPFRMGDLIYGIYGERAEDLDVHFYDGNEVSKRALMYDSTDGDNQPSRFTSVQQLEMGGHLWTMQITARPELFSRVDSGKPAIIAWGGLAASLLLTLLTWSLATGRRRAIGLAQDMNRELIASEQALRDSEAKLQTLLDHAGVAICWANRDGRMEYLNRKFTELFGYALEDIPTKELWYARAYPDASERRNMLERWNNILSNSFDEDRGIEPIERAITCKDGSLRHVIVTYTRVAPRILAIFSDISERKLAEARLQRWAQIFEHAQWGIVVGSADGRRIELANPEFARMRGFSMEELLRLPVHDLFAPEARAELPEHIRIAHEQGHHVFESVHLRKDGTTFPVLINITAVKDENGKVLYRVVNVQDISERKAVERELENSRAVLQAILDNSPYLIWMKDAQGRYVMVNRAYLASVERQEMDEVLGRADTELWPEGLARKFQADDAEVIASGRQKTMVEQGLNQGNLVWLETSRTPVFDAAGKLLGVTGFARDITERKRIEDKVRHQAHYDMLTDLPNRVLFSDRLQQAIATARRDKSILAVMFLDLDRFKPVNDLFGHDVGDIVLRGVAERITGCVRESDTVARIGGDEFCILLPVIENERDAALVADKILQALRQPFQLSGHRIHIASSIGIAIYPKDGKDEAALVRNADSAMYWAKEGGRDSCVMFRPDLPSPLREE